MLSLTLLYAILPPAFPDAFGQDPGKSIPIKLTAFLTNQVA
jgi:hypothetical protein